MLAFLSGIASFATTTYGGDKKQANTWSVTVQKPEEDRAEDSQEPIRQIENLPKTIWKSKNVIDVREKHTTILKEWNDEKLLKQSVMHVDLKKNEKIVDWVIERVRTPFEIYEQVKYLWYRESPTVSLISTCKASSWDPRHCILVWLTLMYNEAWNQQNSKACVDRNNCFGIQSGKKSYSSLDEGMENFVQKYNKYWYKADSAWFFYSKAWKVSPSRYCTSEDSSGSSVGCPRGLSIASDKWNKLYKIIY